MNSHLYQLQQCQSDRKLNKGVLKKRNTAKHNLLEVTRSVAKHATSPPKFQLMEYAVILLYLHIREQSQGSIIHQFLSAEVRKPRTDFGCKLYTD